MKYDVRYKPSFATVFVTLQPGETWTLRHRLYIHQGYAAGAAVADRFDEYAYPLVARVLYGAERCAARVRAGAPQAWWPRL